MPTKTAQAKRTSKRTPKSQPPPASGQPRVRYDTRLPADVLDFLKSPDSGPGSAAQAIIAMVRRQKAYKKFIAKQSPPF